MAAFKSEAAYRTGTLAMSPKSGQSRAQIEVTRPSLQTSTRTTNTVTHNASESVSVILIPRQFLNLITFVIVIGKSVRSL